MPNKVEKYGLFCWNKIYHHIWPSDRPGGVMLCGEVPELPRKPRDDGSFPWMTKLGVGSYSSQRTVHTSLLSSPPSFSFFTTTLADLAYNWLVFFCCIWSNFATVRVWSWVGQWFSNLCLNEDWIWPPTLPPSQLWLWGRLPISCSATTQPLQRLPQPLSLFSASPNLDKSKNESLRNTFSYPNKISCLWVFGERGWLAELNKATLLSRVCVRQIFTFANNRVSVSFRRKSPQWRF